MSILYFHSFVSAWAEITTRRMAGGSSMNLNGLFLFERIYGEEEAPVANFIHHWAVLSQLSMNTKQNTKKAYAQGRGPVENTRASDKTLSAEFPY